MPAAKVVHPDIMEEFDEVIRRAPAWELRADFPQISVPECGRVAFIARGARKQGQSVVRGLVLTNGDAQTALPSPALKAAIRGGVLALEEIAQLVAPDDRSKLAALLTK